MKILVDLHEAYFSTLIILMAVVLLL